MKLLEDLRKAILEYNSQLAFDTAKRIIEEGIDPFKAFGVMTEAIRQVGDDFGKGQRFLPELVGAGQAMSTAMPIIEAEIKKTGKKRASPGTVVIGTVYGDLHNIGKSLVATLLVADGFDVHDLGVNVLPEAFIVAVKKYSADVVAMSALLTTTAPEQRRVVDILNKEFLRDKVKIIVGGGAISQEFADNIGADGYSPTAPGAVKLTRRLLGV